MAKKRSPGGGRPPSGRLRKPVVLQMKGDLAWKEWLGRIAKGRGQTVSQFAEEAIKQWAATLRLEQPPER